MNNQKNSDLAITVLGALVAIASLTTWIRIAVIGVSGMDSWWGFVTFASGVLIASYGASRAWPEFLKSSGYRTNSRRLALVGCAGAIVVLGYVGIRVTDIGRQFDDTVSQSSTDTSGLGNDFDQAVQDFQNSIADAFKPSLAFGWYLGAVSTVLATGLVAKSKEKSPIVDSVLPPPVA